MIISKRQINLQTRQKMCINLIQTTVQQIITYTVAPLRANLVLYLMDSLCGICAVTKANDFLCVCVCASA